MIYDVFIFQNRFLLIVNIVDNITTHVTGWCMDVCNIQKYFFFFFILIFCRKGGIFLFHFRKYKERN